MIRWIKALWQRQKRYKAIADYADMNFITDEEAEAELKELGVIK